jgi:hypothetical protein
MNNNSRAFVNQLVVLLIVTIGVGGGTGIGVVWMRHQISTTANHIRELKARTAETQRLADAKSAEVASAQRPALLRKLNDEFRLGLVPMSDVPLVNDSSEAAIRGLVARATHDLMERAPEVSFKLAQN